jgi:nitroimidazol reductase NimA-like FMN-containing flavoprotein (pyridoxamine 5'-phosphate oxidase superfamily)
MTTQQGKAHGRFEELAEIECRELLGVKTVGRIGFVAEDWPVLLPVNYVVHDGNILFRTAPYNVVASSVRGQRVAFEVDELDDFLQSGWSVLVVGVADFVEDEDELPPDRSGRPEPWADGSRPLYVRITAARITGRRVHPQ